MMKRILLTLLFLGICSTAHAVTQQFLCTTVSGGNWSGSVWVSTAGAQALCTGGTTPVTSYQSVLNASSGSVTVATSTSTAGIIMTGYGNTLTIASGKTLTIAAGDLATLVGDIEGPGTILSQTGGVTLGSNITSTTLPTLTVNNTQTLTSNSHTWAGNLNLDSSSATITLLGNWVTESTTIYTLSTAIAPKTNETYTGNGGLTLTSSTSTNTEAMILSTVNGGTIAFGANNLQTENGLTISGAMTSSGGTIAVEGGGITLGGSSTGSFPTIELFNTGQTMTFATYTWPGGLILATISGTYYISNSGNTCVVGGLVTFGAASTLLDSASTETLTANGGITLYQSNSSTGTAGIIIGATSTISSGTSNATITAPLTFDASGATITISGAFIVSGLITFQTADNIEGGTSITANGGITLNSSQGSSSTTPFILKANQTLTSNGYLFYSPMTMGNASYTITFATSSTWTNEGATTFSGSSDGLVLSPSSATLVCVAGLTLTTAMKSTSSANISITGGTLTGNYAIYATLVTVSTGTVTIGSTLTIDSPLTISSGTWAGGTYTATVASGKLLTIGAATFTGTGGISSGSGGITLSGQPVNSANTFVLTCTASQSLNSNSGADTWPGILTITGTTAITFVGNWTNTGTVSWTGTTTLTSGTGTLIANGSLTSTGAVSGTAGITLSGTGTWSGTGVNTETMTLNGSGTITLGANVQSGTLSITSGTLASGTDTITVASGDLLTIGVATFTGTGGISTSTGGITLSGTATNSANTFPLTITGSETLTSATYTWPGALTVSGTSTITLSGNWTNTGITTIGASTTFSGAYNASLGNLTVSDGYTLILVSGQTYTVTGTFNANASTSITIQASSTGVAYLPVTTLGTVHKVAATKIDSSGGVKIIDTNGSLSGTVNWSVPVLNNAFFRMLR